MPGMLCQKVCTHCSKTQHTSLSVEGGTLALNSLGYTPSFFIVSVCDENQHEELAGVWPVEVVQCVVVG